MSVMIQPQRSLHFLRTGRLVRVQQSEVDWGWAVVLKAYRVAPTPATTMDRLGEAEAADMYRVDTLVCALPQSKGVDGGRLYRYAYDPQHQKAIEWVLAVRPPTRAPPRHILCAYCVSL
jgi:hypothetical protein